MTPEEPSVSTGAMKIDESIRFHYIKASGFRVLHVNGAFGGVTPRGEIHAALFNERLPIPKEVVQTIDASGHLGEVTEVNTREGVVREVEVDLMMSPVVARQFGEWLVRTAIAAEEAMGDIDADNQEVDE